MNLYIDKDKINEALMSVGIDPLKGKIIYAYEKFEGLNKMMYSTRDHKISNSYILYFSNDLFAISAYDMTMKNIDYKNIRKFDSNDVEIQITEDREDVIYAFLSTPKSNFELSIPLSIDDFKQQEINVKEILR
ncbi:MAG: hypothetical protein Q4B52_04285 [Tissierellia bacterium]|nr:hypothetical protein [Tissierellia bacterium]